MEAHVCGHSAHHIRSVGRARGDCAGLREIRLWWCLSVNGNAILRILPNTAVKRGASH
jgi:hypothetical protein